MILKGSLVAGIGLILATVAAAPLDRGAFGRFDRSLNTTDYGYAAIPDPTGAAPAAVVERFEVRPGDCAAERRWSDCANDRERSELSEKGARNPVGSAWWYAWSFYLPDGHPDIDPTKLVLGQFHQQGSHPLLLFRASREGYLIDDNRSGRTRNHFPLIAATDLRGRWHRVVVEARWSTGDDGLFRVWVDDVQKVDLAGPMTAETGPIYFKYGLYRSFISRYSQANGGRVPPAQVVFYAAVRKGKSRADVAPAR